MLNPTFEHRHPDHGTNWRQHAMYYLPDDSKLRLRPGRADLAIRHSQAQEVSHSMYPVPRHHAYTVLQRPDDRIHVSSDLGGSATHPSARQRSAMAWLLRECQFAALVSAALGITHPEQYALSRECLVKLATKRPHLARALAAWPLAFNSLAVIANRCSPDHRDRRGGGKRYYDVMATIGGDADLVIDFKGLGFRGRYCSGAMVNVFGHVHLHSVSRSTAERIAFAAFVNQSVPLVMGLSPPRYPTLDLINSIHSQQI